MAYGFFVRMRCLVLVDSVVIKCYEARIYHEFEESVMLREDRWYQQSAKEFFDLHPTIKRDDHDAIVSALPITRREILESRVDQ